MTQQQLRPPFDVVDAQVHLTLTLDEPALLAAMDELGIAGVVLDEFWHITDDLRGMPSDPLPDGAFRPLSPLAQAAALKHPDRFAYLQRVERRDPEITAVMRLLGASPGCRAVRVVLLNADERAAFGDGRYDQILGLAQAAGLPLCVLGVDLACLSAVTQRYPDLPIVLDHCGWARNPQHWEQVLQASRLPTVHLKWCHAARAFRTADDLAETTTREFLRALDAYGTHRVLWAADATEEHSGSTWSDLLAFVTQHPSLSHGDKQQVLSGTARALFRWPVLPRSAATVETVKE